MSEIYVNGAFFDEKDAKISVFDRGFLYGDGLFETLRAYSGEIFRLEDHLERLSQASHRIALPFEREKAKKALWDTLHRNRFSDALLRLTITRGQGPPGIDLPINPQPTMVIFTRPFTGYPGQENGIYVHIAEIRKTPKESLDSSLKSLNFLNNILARQEASLRKTQEAIILNKDGYLAEGSVSNLFWVSGNALHTPALDTGILPGVTRKVVLELADKENIPYKEGFYKPQDLFSADEVFLTNTGYEIMPVQKVDTTPFLSPGPLTVRLLDAYHRSVSA